MSNRMRHLRPRGDRPGIARPVALVGLVAVSLLVTTALLSSTAESAISQAQTNAARALYQAEGGLHEFMRARAAAGLGITAGTSTVTLPEGGTVQITAAILRHSETAADEISRTISLLAEPVSNGQVAGRAVVALIEQNGEYVTMDLQVDEGAVVGSDLEVGGSSQIIDRSRLCSDTTDVGAIRHSADADVDTTGSGVVSGRVTESANTGEDFEREILNGRTLDELAELAEIQFGSRWGKANWDNNARVEVDAADSRYRWGCPSGMDVTCTNPADTLYYPIIAVDASGSTGRQIDIQGDYGQGILIVLNGSMRITGNFQFKGVILIDGYIDMTGTGGRTGSKIEGSVIAFGEVTGTGSGSRISESETTGNAVISFNRCALNAAQQSFNDRARANPVYSPPSSTFAWFEVVR